MAMETILDERKMMAESESVCREGNKGQNITRNNVKKEKLHKWQA